MVIVDPDQIAILNILDDGLGEEAVDLLVCGPSRLVEGNLTGVIMEEGPEDGVYTSFRLGLLLNVGGFGG